MGGMPQNFTINGNTMIVAGYNDVYAVDITDPSNPTIIDSESSSSESTGLAYDGNTIINLNTRYGYFIYSFTP